MPIKAIPNLRRFSHPASLPFNFKSCTSRNVDMASEIHVCLYTQFHEPFKMSQFCPGNCHYHEGEGSDASLRTIRLKMRKSSKFILPFKVFLAEDQRKEKEKSKILHKTMVLYTKKQEN